MKLKTFFTSLSFWESVASGFVATVLGILVTVGLARYQERKQTEQNKRDLTIMIIHDLDESERYIREMVDLRRAEYEKLLYVYQYQYHLDAVSIDTINAALKAVTISWDHLDHDFPQMAENIMTNNLDNWSTLSNVKFMENVEECYMMRRKYNDFLVPQEVFEPVLKLYTDLCLSVTEPDPELRSRIIAGRLCSPPEMEAYVRYFRWSMSYSTSLAVTLHELNKENKWLMSVSDEDIRQFVETSSQRVATYHSRISRKALVGRWVADYNHFNGLERDLKKQEFLFYKNGRLEVISVIDANQTTNDTVYTRIDTCCGHWSIVGKDIRLEYDSVGVLPDIFSNPMLRGDELSTMHYEEGKEDNKSILRLVRQ